MELSINEKIKIIMKRRKITQDELAQRLHMSRQNLSNKFRRNSFTDDDYRRIAAILDCTYTVTFSEND